MIRTKDIETRIQWIDWMKAIGMLLIVWGHFFPPHASKYIYSINVPLFFFISGYLQKPDLSWRNWWNKQWSSLFRPYLLLCSIKLLIDYTTSFTFSWLSVVKSVGLVLTGWHSYNDIPGCGVLWFLYALFGVRLLYQLLHRYPILHGVVTLIFFIFAGWYGGVHMDTGLDLWSIQAVPLVYPVFYLATLKSVHRLFNIECKWWQALSLLVVLLPLFYFVTRGQNMPLVFIADYGKNYFNYTIGVLSGIAIVYMMAILMNFISYIYIYIYYISTGTLIVLAFHPYLIKIISTYQITICGNYIIETFVYSILILVVAIPFVILVMRYMPWLIGKTVK